MKSLLVHHGGLTFKKPVKSEKLCLPNVIARRRVGEVILSYYGLDDTHSVAAAQDQFLLHDDIAPLLQLVTRVLAQTHCDDEQLNRITELQLETDLCFLLSLPPPYYVHAEYEVKVGENRITGKQYTRYLDVMVQRRNATKASVWVFELKNRQAQYLDPLSFPASAKLPTDRN